MSRAGGELRERRQFPLLQALRLLAVPLGQRPLHAIDIPVQEAASGTRKKVTARVIYPDGRTIQMPLIARIDTVDEIAYFKSGGILQHVLRNLLAA